MGKFKDADLTIKTIKLFPDLKKKLRKGTISTIETPAKKFVDIRSRVKKAGGYAMGGEATESLRKGQIFKEKRDKRRNEVDEMIERLYGPGIKPKKKPKNLDKIRPKTKPKKPQESIMKKRNDFARMLYSRADKLSGTARQTAIKKADDFIRYIDVQNKRPVRPRSKVKK